MAWLTHPTSFLAASRDQIDSVFTMQGSFVTLAKDGLPPHSSHPSFGHLTLLVFEAVLEVVFVSLPGYLVARQGMFDADAQKFVANLNVMVFTPCLIFTKLASQLTADKLIDLAIIPFIFAAQTLVSWLCATIMSRLFRFSKRETNFVTAMGVFGNSNSLPISLVLSLSKTISGLHWDQIPGDNDNEVAARGILYLMIFQQLGQLLRWSWGYNVLLAPAESYEESDESTHARIEGGYRDEEDDEDSSGTNFEGGMHASGSTTSGNASGQRTPLTHQQYTDSISSKAPSRDGRSSPDVLQAPLPVKPPTANDGHYVDDNDEDNVDAMTSFPAIASHTTSNSQSKLQGLRGYSERIVTKCRNGLRGPSSYVAEKSAAAFGSLPLPAQKTLTFMWRCTVRFIGGVWAFMNPPLWAMLVALLVASIPRLQRLCFEKGTFVNNSIISAVAQSGGVAVPLILVVLGANLARNTLPKDKASLEDSKVERKLLIASLISRMLLPILIMAPLLALTAKFVPISILDDPIFVIVCFLLTGAPSALQLAQICQINNVYMGTVSNLLFQSYVVWILPSTLFLVMCALEVVEWAQNLN